MLTLRYIKSFDNSQRQIFSAIKLKVCHEKFIMTKQIPSQSSFSLQLRDRIDYPEGGVPRLNY